MSEFAGESKVPGGVVPLRARRQGLRSL